MIFTCDNCNYTFAAPKKPDSCPDCGKSVAHKVINNGVYEQSYTCPAVRVANTTEKIWFERVQSELKASNW